MIYLYVKTHNKTGLKYLGKTVQDPYKYKGSGKRWINHLKIHGNDVTTEILLATESVDELRETGKYFSKIFTVKSSSNWANIKDEEGDGGDYWSNLERPAETKRKISDSLTGQIKSDETKRKIKESVKRWYENNAAVGHGRREGFTHSEETKKKMRKPRKELVCPHCNKTGRGSAMKQWHFDKCKMK